MMRNWDFDSFRESRKNFSGSHEVRPILGSSEDDGPPKR